METMERYLQQIDNAVSNFTREILVAARLCGDAATEEQKQAILARLDAEKDLASGIVTEARERLTEYADEALKRIERAAAQKGNY